MFSFIAYRIPQRAKVDILYDQLWSLVVNTKQVILLYLAIYRTCVKSKIICVPSENTVKYYWINLYPCTRVSHYYGIGIYFTMHQVIPIKNMEIA